MYILMNFAFKNLLGAGIRTWLNTIILAIVLVAILFLQGVYDGFQRQTEKIRTQEETGLSQLWYKKLNPQDPITFQKNLGSLEPISRNLESNSSTAILLVSGIIYPQNRLQPIIIKGIEPNQSVLKINTSPLSEPISKIPAMVGNQMAKQLQLKIGDTFVISFRTSNDVIDAHDLEIVSIFSTNAPAMDLGQIWIPLKPLQRYLNAPNKASLIISKKNLRNSPSKNWALKTEDELLSDTRKMMEAEKSGGYFIYSILMFLALISLLDTQILAIFRRKKEVGLFMALGLTQRQIIGIFTFEGVAQGLFASFIALVIGTPLFIYLSSKGIHLGNMNQFGLASTNTLFPHFTFSLIASTFTIIMFMIIFVSYLPARKIGKLSPSKALRGKWL